MKTPENQTYPFIDLTKLREKIQQVASNKKVILEYTEINKKYLKSIIDSYLSTGLEIESFGQHSYLDRLILVPWNNKKDEKITNMEYILSRPNNLFFVSENSITEIYFEDTLPFTKEYELIENNDNGFTIELTFWSTRQRNREKFVFANKYRFVWSAYKSKMSVRKMEE